MGRIALILLIFIAGALWHRRRMRAALFASTLSPAPTAPAPPPTPAPAGSPAAPTVSRRSNGWAQVPHELRRTLKPVHCSLYQAIQAWEFKGSQRRPCTASLRSILLDWPGGITERYARMLLADLERDGWVLRIKAPGRVGRALVTRLAHERVPPGTQMDLLPAEPSAQAELDLHLEPDEAVPEMTPEMTPEPPISVIPPISQHRIPRVVETSLDSTSKADSCGPGAGGGPAGLPGLVIPPELQGARVSWALLCRLFGPARVSEKAAVLLASYPGGTWRKEVRNLTRWLKSACERNYPMPAPAGAAVPRPPPPSEPELSAEEEACLKEAAFARLRNAGLAR